MKKKKTITFQELETETAAKDYVPKATNLTEGSTGNEVERLQSYLTKFGYFKDQTDNEFFAAGLKTELPKSPKSKGNFDKNTVEALKKFQQLNSLPVSGELDEPTLDLMSKPRCGFPDTAQFVAQGNKWTTNALTYGFQNFSSDLSQAQVRTAIAQALGLWSAVTPLTFTEIPFANNPHIKIRFVSGDHGDGANNAFDGPSGVLAHAFYPPPNGGDLAGDAHFDEAETWSVNLPVTGIDLVTVAAHEFGHSLGLDHSAVSGALMFAFYGGAHRNLEADDIAGIQSIYGRRAGGWASRGGVITSNIAIARNADGRLEIFARGTDGAVWHQWQTAQNNGWSGWASLGGAITSDIAVGQNADGRLELFVRGTDGAVWHKWQTAPNNGWSGWASRGGVITGNIAVGRNVDGRMEIFARGTDGAVWHQWQTAPNRPFSGWASRNGVINGNITVGRNADGRMEIFARATDGAVWHQWQIAPNRPFSGWSSLGGVITSNIAVGQNADGRLELFARGANGAVWHKWQTAPNNGWSGWASRGGVIIGNITVSRNADGRMEIFAKGTDGAVWHQWQTAPNRPFSGWSSLGGVITSDITVGQNADGRMEVLVRGTNNAVWHRWQTAPSNGWN
jgi:peptidoglycan hydrolase-like protein with peptidoglycan-binding domain/acylphosphatase